MFTVDNKTIHTDFTKDPFLNFLWLNEIKHPEDYNTRDIMPYYDIEKQDISKTLIISGENLEEYYWNGLFDNLVSYTEKLICFGYELFHPRYEFYFEHMDLILKKYNKTLYILGPWTSDKQYSNIKFIGKHFLSLTLIDNHYIDKQNDRDKDFFALFRLDKYNRPFRKMFYNVLNKNVTLMKNSTLYHNKFEDIKAIHDINENINLEYGYDSIIPHKLYRQYNFEIISEVNVENNKIFYPTEKIFKPLMYGFPFLVYANQNFLKCLRLMGFQTFSNIIDETYDNEVDPINRIHKIEKSLEKIKSFGTKELFKQCRHICEYNQEHAHALKGKFELHNKKMYKKIIDILQR